MSKRSERRQLTPCVSESQFVSKGTTAVVIPVRRAKKPKKYLNTEDIIKELKILSCKAEEIIEHRDQRTLAHSIQYYTQYAFTDKKAASLCVRNGSRDWLKLTN
jgi:hypothetical protein